MPRKRVVASIDPRESFSYEPQARTSGDHKVIGHLHPDTLQKFANSKAITIDPNEFNDESLPLVKIIFSAKPHLNRLHRNVLKNKNTLLKPEHIHDIGVHMYDQHSGQGFFDSIRRVFSSPVIKSVVAAAAPMILQSGSSALSNLVASKTGNAALGDAMGSMAGNMGASMLSNYTGQPQQQPPPPEGSGLRHYHAGGSMRRAGGSFAPLGGSIGNTSASQQAAKSIESLQQGISFQGPASDFRNPDKSKQMAWVRSHRGTRNF